MSAAEWRLITTARKPRLNLRRTTTRKNSPTMSFTSIKTVSDDEDVPHPTDYSGIGTLFVGLSRDFGNNVQDEIETVVEDLTPLRLLLDDLSRSTRLHDLRESIHAKNYRRVLPTTRWRTPRENYHDVQFSGSDFLWKSEVKAKYYLGTFARKPICMPHRKRM
jgi:hypothetical protein